jgi:SAM-dependent methyltransferase
MDKYCKQNRSRWNELTPVHEKSPGYDVAGFKAGRNTIMDLELKEVGDVEGKSLLHLQCHFGLDTLSWARLGAKATGVDFSGEAIKLARKLSKETGIKADFIESDIYLLPEVLKKRYDIVFTSYGVLCWLPDIDKWAQVISHFLKRGGFFYIAEGHPFSTVFDNSAKAIKLEVAVPYFYNKKPIKWEPEPDYADGSYTGSQATYEWMHPIGDVINALIQAGLRIEFVHESPVSFYKAMPFMVQNKNGEWHLEGDPIPLVFSIKATKI